VPRTGGKRSTARDGGLRHLLVGLDGSDWSRAGITLACDIARRSQARLTGVAILDPHDIELAVGPVPMGALYYAEQREDDLMRAARGRMAGLAAEFRKQCEREKVPHAEILEEGVPFRRLVIDAAGHDLLVLGQRTYFHHPPRDTPGDTLRRLLRSTTRPVLAARREPLPVRRAAVALDSSAQAGRALQLFALLSPWTPESVRLLHVGDDREAARGVLGPAAEYLAAHGMKTETVVLQGTARQVIPDYVASEGIDLVVLGAHGKLRLDTLLFGGVTAALLESGRASLFLTT
jgi:nucleotide-binding universal stress UspA family protein